MRAQPQKCGRRHSARKNCRLHRQERLRQDNPRIRHNLRGRIQKIHGKPIRGRKEGFEPNRQAGSRFNIGAVAGNRHRADKIPRFKPAHNACHPHGNRGLLAPRMERRGRTKMPARRRKNIPQKPRRMRRRSPRPSPRRPHLYPRSPHLRTPFGN